MHSTRFIVRTLLCIQHIVIGTRKFSPGCVAGLRHWINSNSAFLACMVFEFRILSKPGGVGVGLTFVL